MLDQMAVAAAFSQPDADAMFRGAFGDYLSGLGRRRQAIIFAFPPKCAGTFLANAAVAATGGQFVRIVHAQGDRDAQPYLPLFISYYLGELCEGPLVSHVHMQALPGNRGILDAFGLKPVVMIRSIPDMLASFWDMLDDRSTARPEGLNCPLPDGFETMPDERKADFCIDMLAPWYVGFYATWFAYHAAAPGRVCVLKYEDMHRDPTMVLERALTHAGLSRPYEVCRAALQESWSERDALRFNRGENGRGRAYFAPHHLERLDSMLSFHPHLEVRREALLA